MRVAGLLLLLPLTVFSQTPDIYGGYSDLVVGEPRCAAGGEAVFNVTAALWDAGRNSTVFTLTGHKVNQAGAEVKITGATGAWAALNYNWPTVKTWTAYKINDTTFEIRGLDSSSWGAFSGTLTFSACFFDLRLRVDRWVLVTPKGNLYFARSLQAPEQFAVPGYPKYPAADSTTMQRLWGEHTRQRAWRWGFNAFGPYGNSYVDGPIAAPATGIPQFLLVRPSTYTQYQNFAVDSVTYPAQFPNTLWCATPRFYSADATTTATLIDVYDPNWSTALFGPAGDGTNGWYAMRFWPDYRLGSMSVRYYIVTDPWIVGVTIDDGDNLYGVSGGYNTHRPKAHAGFVALCSQDPLPATGTSARGLAPNCVGGGRTNSTKLALRDFLKARYGDNLASLNAAWGSSYTSWEHDGGWNSGTGLLDESCNHSWVCAVPPEGPLPSDQRCGTTDIALFNPQTAAFKQDIQDFGAEWVTKYARTTVDAWKGFDPNHLVFGPDAFNGWGFMAHPSYLPALRDAGFDAYWLSDNYDWTCELGGTCYDAGKGKPIYDDRITPLRRFYDVVKKPIITWVGAGANLDSGLSGFAARDTSDLEDYPTQEERAAKSYSASLRRILFAKGTDGVNFGVGVGWWQVHDRPKEHHSWGVSSVFDNWYDGVHAKAPPPIGGSGYPSGWSGARSNRPFSCEAGDLYWATDEAAPSNFYVCGTSHNWQAYACNISTGSKYAVQSVSGTTMTIGAHDILVTDRAVVWGIPGLYRYSGVFTPSALDATSITTTTLTGIEASVGGLPAPPNRGWVAKIPAICTSGEYLLQAYSDSTWNLFYCSGGALQWWRRDDTDSGNFLLPAKAANDSVYNYLKPAGARTVPVKP